MRLSWIPPLLALPLSGCISAGLAWNAAVSGAENVLVSEDTPAFVQTCREWGGSRADFSPDPEAAVIVLDFAGLSPYQARCGARCARLLEAGWGRVAVRGEDAPEGETLACFISGEAPGAPPRRIEPEACAEPDYEAVRAVTRSPGLSAAYSPPGARDIAVEEPAAGRMAGMFDGVRRLSDGALNGSGGFILRRQPLHPGDPGQVSARCGETP